MGYILPIQQHEYHDYHRRVAKVRRNRYEIEKPFKVILERQYEETKKQQTNRLTGSNQEQVNDNPLFVVTGKGNFINTQI